MSIVRNVARKLRRFTLREINQYVRSVTLENKKYYCLFCGEDGETWDTVEELFAHMETTIHKDEKGGLIIPTGKVEN